MNFCHIYFLSIVPSKQQIVITQAITDRHDITEILLEVALNTLGFLNHQIIYHLGK
jgi:hypothetical protein